MLHRRIFVALGFVFMAIGIVGIVLPVLPTTPFMLLALWSFARSSDRFHDWLLNHRRFGPPLQRWNDHGIIPNKAKISALAVMSISLIFLIAFSAAPPYAVITAALLMLVGALFILTRPSRPPNRTSQAVADDD